MTRVLIVLAFAAFGAAACVAPLEKVVTCQTQAQWYTDDAKGNVAAAVHVCFGEQKHLMYEVAPLTAADRARLAAPAAPETTEQAIARKMAADPKARP